MDGNVLEAKRSAPHGQTYEPKAQTPRNYGVPSRRQYALRFLFQVHSTCVSTSMRFILFGDPLEMSEHNIMPVMLFYA